MKQMMGGKYIYFEVLEVNCIRLNSYLNMKSLKTQIVVVAYSLLICVSISI